jgi:serine/threonine protein kinase
MDSPTRGTFCRRYWEEVKAIFSPYVTKIAKQNVAETELRESESLRMAIDPYGRFTAPALAICKASEHQINQNYTRRLSNIKNRGLNTLIFSRYRGDSILNIFETVDTLSIKEVKLILVALANLLINVSIFVNGKAGVLHYDAHPGNIVYDSDTKEASLIDFGYARPLDHETHQRLLAGDYSVKATMDITKIFELSIMQFFQFGNSAPTNILMKNPYLNEWYKNAKILNKNPEATQEEYMDIVRDLEQRVLVSAIEHTNSARTIKL